MRSCDLNHAARFIGALIGDDHGSELPVVFRTFDDGPAKRPWLGRVLTGSLTQHAAELQRLNARGACVAVAVNVLRGTQRRACEVTALRALFIDCDAALARPLALPPSISVQSKNGPHHYWLLAAGEPVSLFAAAQRRLAAVYGADPMVSDPSRVMRVPGFLHQKGEPYLVELIGVDPTRRYAMRDILHRHAGGGGISVVAPPTRSRSPSPEAVRAFRRWAAAAPRIKGARNVTAFVMAAEGLKTGVPEEAVTAEVRAYCDRAGIPDEATAVIRSARRRAGR
jgi:RepB DNA-primase N-terminal domain